MGIEVIVLNARKEETGQTGRTSGGQGYIFVAALSSTHHYSPIRCLFFFPRQAVTMSAHMSKPAFELSRHLRAILLTSLLLSGAGIWCPPAQANYVADYVAEQSGLSSMRSLIVHARVYALRTYQDKCTEN